MDISAFDAALRIFYLHIIRKQLSEKSILLQNIKKDTKRIDASGKYARLTLNYEWSQGIGARAEGADLPGNVDAGYVNSDVYMKYVYGRIKISGPVMSASRDNKGSIARALSSEMQSATTCLRNDINRQLFGDGSGALALVASDSYDGGTGLTTVTVDTTKYIKKGMKFDTYDAKTGGTISQNSKTVLSVLTSTTFTVTGDISGETGNYIFREDTHSAGTSPNVDKEMMGLLGIIDQDDYVGTLQGIDRSAGGGNQWWEASIQGSGSNADLKLSDLQDAWTKGEQNDAVTKFIVTTFSLRDAYADLLMSDRRYVNTLELKGGFKGLAFNDVPIVADKDAIANTMFLVDPSTLSLFISKDLSWMDDDGSILSRVANKDEFEAIMRIYQNLGVDNCVKNVALRSVQ